MRVIAMKGYEVVEWRDVPGYEGLYKVSDGGRVWSRPRHSSSGGLLSRLFHPGMPYPVVRLSKNGQECTYLVHRLVLEAFVGPCPEGHETRHLNGDPADNCLENLCWGTPSENRQDSVKHRKARVNLWKNRAVREAV